MIRIWFASLWVWSLFGEAFVFVHLGPTLPPYTAVAMDQVRLFNPDAPIYLLANEEAIRGKEWSGVSAVPVESLQKSESHERFCRETTNGGLWRFSVERFLCLDDFVSERGLRDVFHLENDVMVYRDFRELLPVFQEHYRGKIGAVFDSDTRCIAGFVYISDPEPLQAFARFVGERTQRGETDMELLSRFKDETKQAVHLPIVLPSYSADYPLQSLQGETVREAAPFLKCFDAFRSVFDAAALGQYWGGDDPLHAGIRPGFINERAVFNPAAFHFEWRQDERERYVPWIEYGTMSCPINNLHVHCKDLASFYSCNAAMPKAPLSRLLSLEKIDRPQSADPVDVVVVLKERENGLAYLEMLRGMHFRRIVAISAEKPQGIEWFDEKQFSFGPDAICSEIFGSDRGGLARFKYHPRSLMQPLYRQLLKLYAPRVIPGLSENVLVLEVGEAISKQTEMGPFKPQHRSFACKLLPVVSLDYAGVKGTVVFNRQVLDDFFGQIEAYHRAELWRVFCQIAKSGDHYGTICSAGEIYLNYTSYRFNP